MTNASSADRCTVVGADKVISALGGIDALCAIVESAIASSATKASVQIEVLNPNAAVARTTVAGQLLQERRIDASDRPLNRRSIELLAKAVADQLNALKS